MSSENRKRAAYSGWARRRGCSEAEPAGGCPSEIRTIAPDPAQAREALYEAYRVAKAKHDAAITALRRASHGAGPDAELVRRQAEAAVEEFEALAALRGQGD